ncbi:conserved protein of unknown function [Ruminococcaceae bacterium BL-6]|nr:conserved protein of unknown function [Ruminococcaceae bacterium BL-6]
MKDGFVQKSAGEKISEREMERINAYTRRPFAAKEVYAFSLVLCDNEIDRDWERFTIPALKKLEKLFLGKTGIFDHSGKSSDQTARIFSTALETDPEKRTRAGEPYTRLTARAYLPRTQKNADLIMELESGIKKEVSVGCAVGSASCSVCGADLKRGACGHRKGKSYSVKGEEILCCAVLDDPQDAYEWSFVAVPAQRAAGVIKSFETGKKEEKRLEDIQKALSREGEEVVLTKGEARKLLGRLEELEAQAGDGRRYREQLCANVERLCLLVKSGIEPAVMRRAAEKMTMDDLLAAEKSLRRKADELLPVHPQLAPGKKKAPADDAAFRI